MVSLILVARTVDDYKGFPDFSKTQSTAKTSAFVETSPSIANDGG